VQFDVDFKNIEYVFKKSQKVISKKLEVIWGLSTLNTVFPIFWGGCNFLSELSESFSTVLKIGIKFCILYASYTICKIK
jgi:hypothetical protein